MPQWRTYAFGLAASALLMPTLGSFYAWSVFIAPLEAALLVAVVTLALPTGDRRG